MGLWWRWRWRWRWKIFNGEMLRKWNDIVPTYIEATKKISNVKFFTVDPYFGVVFPPDTQKVLKTSTSSSVRPWLRGSSYSSQLKWISISMRQSTVGLKCWWLRRCCWRVLSVTKHPVFWKGDFWIVTGPLLFVHSQAYRDFTGVDQADGWLLGLQCFVKLHMNVQIQQ